MKIDNIVSSMRATKVGGYNLYEGYITYYRKGRPIWREYSKVKRLTTEDAFADALDLRADYKEQNLIQV
jgi:hypothetical protein